MRQWHAVIRRSCTSPSHRSREPLRADVSRLVERLRPWVTSAADPTQRFYQVRS
jgi:hypothetical protein